MFSHVHTGVTHFAPGGVCRKGLITGQRGHARSTDAETYQGGECQQQEDDQTGTRVRQPGQVRSREGTTGRGGGFGLLRLLIGRRVGGPVLGGGVRCGRGGIGARALGRPVGGCGQAAKGLGTVCVVRYDGRPLLVGGRGGGFETYPAHILEVQFGPGVRVTGGDRPAAVTVLFSLGVTDGDPGGDVCLACHHGHGSGELLAVTGVVLEEEMGQWVGIVGYRGWFEVVGEVGEVLLQGDRALVGGGQLARQRVGEILDRGVDVGR